MIKQHMFGVMCLESAHSLEVHLQMFFCNVTDCALANHMPHLASHFQDAKQFYSGS